MNILNYSHLLSGTNFSRFAIMTKFGFHLQQELSFMTFWTLLKRHTLRFYTNEIRNFWCCVVCENGTQFHYSVKANPTPNTFLDGLFDSFGMAQENPNYLEHLSDRLVSPISYAVGTMNRRNVDSYDNSADIVSPGCNADGLKDDELWNEPTWPATHLPSETQAEAKTVDLILPMNFTQPTQPK